MIAAAAAIDGQGGQLVSFIGDVRECKIREQTRTDRRRPAKRVDRIVDVKLGAPIDSVEVRRVADRYESLDALHGAELGPHLPYPAHVYRVGAAGAIQEAR